jgi:hypothetical protein
MRRFYVRDVRVSYSHIANCKIEAWDKTAISLRGRLNLPTLQLVRVCGRQSFNWKRLIGGAEAIPLLDVSVGTSSSQRKS